MFISKNLTRRAALFLLAAACPAALLACSGAPRDAPATPSAAATPRATPSPRPPATPPPVAPDAERTRGAGAFEQYKFTYARAGDETVADFRPLKLPHTNQNVVVAAARRVILAAYGEPMENLPRRVAWDYKETKHAVKLEGERYDYVFVPVRDEDKDIPQLVVWRVGKGSVQ